MEVLQFDDLERIKQYLSTREEPANINNEDTIHVDIALYFACEENRNDVVDVLIQYGANVNYQIGSYEETSLFISCESGHVDIINRLLQAGADPNIPNINGITPIMTASQSGYLNIVKLLTIYTNFNITNKYGDTIFSYAISSKNNDIIDYAFDYCTDINHTNKEGWSYLHYAVYNKYKYAISLLLNKHIDVNIEDNIGRKAINLTYDPEIRSLLSSS